MPNLIKIKIQDVSLNQAVADEKDFPIKDSNNKDVRYCQLQANFYMFNGVRWFPIELV